ncbi:MAG: response regulator [Candidatus Nitrohelix vancouverensis]|uniref:histidine kinase n=1 Tax=Candidatus Nitrohelix vancouverensis TaxID=2705534 RepID=A0A7T0G2Z5_9BACT|nr:MAG: response regulator [Candidatus Nitrohelix vancouverensis]
MNGKIFTPNILIVDDRQENIFALEKLLRRVDANIISANSGNEALSIILRHSLALILLDVQMDGMDGFETAALIREYEGTKDTPIIFVTAINNDQHHIFQGYQSGAVDYLSKPLDPDILISKVNVFLQIHQQKIIQEDLIRKLQVSKNKLAESEIRIHSVLNNIQDAVITTDKSGSILSFNMAAEKMFQYTFAEIIEKSLEKIMDIHSFRAYMDTIKEHISEPRKKILVSNMRIIGSRKNGQTFPGEMGISHITIDGQRLYTSSIRDVTQRETYETSLIEAKNEALKANHAKSTFLANMSHELRTPLNAIIGFSQLMQQNPNEVLTESQNENIGQILSAGKHLLGLINDILDLSKIEAEKTFLSMEPIVAYDLIQEIHDLVRTMGSELNIKLEVNNNCPRDIFFKGDLTRTKQVLLNLLSNSFKYNRPNGTVILGCDIDETSNKHVLFTVVDNGLGISEESLKNIFEPFNRGDAEGSQIEGTGIGLSITKKLIEAMEGSLRVTSTLGKGSSFEVSLPLCEKVQFKEQQHTSINKDSAPPESLNSIQEEIEILYIEDNPANLLLIEKFLDAYPLVSLKTAVTAEIGLEVVKRDVPDILLLDINLPGMSGLELCRLLREDDDFPRIPIIGLSANAMKTDKRRALEIGFDDYLTKPVDLYALTRCILSTVKSKSV